MLTLLPTWWVEYRRRRPTIIRPLTSRDYLKIEVGAMDRDGAAAAFRQRFPVECEIVAIYMASPTGFA